MNTPPKCVFITYYSSDPNLIFFSKALLDVYTIRSELGTVNGRTITLIGDLKNGRTVHSLVTLLSLYSVRLNFVAPASLAMPQSVINAARKAGIFVRVCDSLEEVLSETDVLYVTRVQKERFESEEDWVRVKDAYRIDHSILSRAKEDMIVMHPLPRVNGVFVHCTTLRLSCLTLIYRDRPRGRLRFTPSGLLPADALWIICTSCVLLLKKLITSYVKLALQVRMALLASVMG